MCLNGTPLGSVKMQSAQLPQVTEFKYLGSTLLSDGDTSTEINMQEDTVDGTTGGRCHAGGTTGGRCHASYAIRE